MVNRPLTYWLEYVRSIAGRARLSSSPRRNATVKQMSSAALTCQPRVRKAAATYSSAKHPDGMERLNWS
jgi:hypothetical protein